MHKNIYIDAQNDAQKIYILMRKNAPQMMLQKLAVGIMSFGFGRGARKRGFVGTHTKKWGARAHIIANADDAHTHTHTLPLMRTHIHTLVCVCLCVCA